jgi:hypothetical protein
MRNERTTKLFSLSDKPVAMVHHGNNQRLVFLAFRRDVITTKIRGRTHTQEPLYSLVPLLADGAGKYFLSQDSSDIWYYTGSAFDQGMTTGQLSDVAADHPIRIAVNNNETTTVGTPA